MTKTATTAITIMYFHKFPEALLAEDCWSFSFPEEALEDWPCFEVSCEGSGTGAGDWFCFLSFGTAEKAPLLKVVGREMIWMGGPPVMGAAARLLDWSSSLRPAELTRFGMFSTISVSEEPT